MSLHLVVSDLACEQMGRACAWYDVQVPGLGDKFVAALNDDLSSIRSLPRGYPVIRGAIRQAPMRRFPYVIMYQVTRAQIRILRVVHGKRHPRQRVGRR